MSEPHSAFPPGTIVPVPEQFACPLCGATYSVRGFCNHVARCCCSAGLSLAEYEKRYSTYLYSPVHRFAATWFSLAKFSVTRFGLMDYGGCYWCQIDADKPQDWYRDRFGRKPETLPLVLCKDGQRPSRHGELFVCVSRGSFPTCDRSVYHLSEGVPRQLGWGTEGGDPVGFPPLSCSAPAVPRGSVVVADDQFTAVGPVAAQ